MFAGGQGLLGGGKTLPKFGGAVLGLGDLGGVGIALGGELFVGLGLSGELLVGGCNGSLGGGQGGGIGGAGLAGARGGGEIRLQFFIFLPGIGDLGA